jgi:hypothetical protein
VSAQKLLADLQEKGFALAPEGDGIWVTPSSRLTAELRQAIRAAKADLRALLSPTLPSKDRKDPASTVQTATTTPWDQPAADAVVAGLQERRQLLYGPSMSPSDQDSRRRLGQWMDRVDAAFLAHDLPGLRRLAAEFPARQTPPVAPTAEDAAAGPVPVHCDGQDSSPPEAG